MGKRGASQYRRERLLERPGGVLSYAAEASYPFYVLHQTVIVALGFVIVRLPCGVAPKYVLLVGAAFTATLALYELAVRRFNPVRFLFGMRRAQRSPAILPASRTGPRT
ncbi:MAG: hypothetical protein C4521_13650 [Actinobacteria bacterium]|nr:MAG: hypothetical protein C4521_13650 [Actinomycetota bacterium]